jgi:hypothetical protein
MNYKNPHENLCKYEEAKVVLNWVIYFYFSKLQNISPAASPASHPSPDSPTSSVPQVSSCWHQVMTILLVLFLTGVIYNYDLHQTLISIIIRLLLLKISLVLLTVMSLNHGLIVLVREDMDENEYERLSNITPRHIL